MLSHRNDQSPPRADRSALSPRPQLADTLVTNVNGIQVDADGKIQHFTRRCVIGDDGKVRQTARHPRAGRLAHAQPPSTAAGGHCCRA